MDFSGKKTEIDIESWIGNSKEKNPSVIDGKNSQFNEPNGLWAWFKKGEFKGILVADTGNNCIRLAKLNGEVETLELTGIPDVRETSSDCKDGVCVPNFEKL
jgi:hypothetical protein